MVKINLHLGLLLYQKPYNTNTNHNLHTAIHYVTSTHNVVLTIYVNTPQYKVCHTFPFIQIILQITSSNLIIEFRKAKTRFLK